MLALDYQGVFPCRFHIRAQPERLRFAATCIPQKLTHCLRIWNKICSPQLAKGGDDGIIARWPGGSGSLEIGRRLYQHDSYLLSPVLALGRGHEIGKGSARTRHVPQLGDLQLDCRVFNLVKKDFLGS